MKIGFIGLGAMGGPIAGHLIDAGHVLHVHTRSRESAAATIARGATWVTTPRDVAAQSDLVFTVLPGPPEVDAVMHGEHGLLAGLRRGATCIDMTTNSPDLVRRLAGELKAIGVSMLDAPVSGGPKGAASKKLAIWVSGERAAFDAHEAVLKQVGDQVRFLGAIGSATVAKLVHNCANYGIQMVLAEVFTLGVKAGVDPLTLFGAVRQGSLGRQNVVDRLADHFLPSDFDTPAFKLELAQKDVMLATALGRESGVPMRFASLTIAEMTEARNRGWGQRDSRATMLLQEERAGVEIKVPREKLQELLKAEPR
jgi:3-hydroxyisobutyrate dehydrogenase